MRILTFDTESSTGCINDGSLCSLGYYLIDTSKNEIVQEDILIKPLAKFRKGIIGKNGKVGLAYEEDVFYSSPKFFKLYQKIKDLFASADIVFGFAIENDVKYLRNACEKYNLPQIEYRFADVKQLLELYDDELKDKGLSGIGEALNLDFIAHRSDEDARLTYLVLEYLCKKQQKSIEELLSFAEIVLGENSQTEFTHSYSLAQLYGRNGFKRTGRQSAELFEHALTLVGVKNRGGKLFKKSIAISKIIRYENIDKSLAIVKKIYELSGKYAPCVGVANVFVYRDGVADKELEKAKEYIASGKRLTLLEESVFLELLEKIEVESFDYLSVIKQREKLRQQNKKENNLKNKIKIKARTNNE